MNTALSALLSPVPVEAFYRDYYPERHLTVHGSLDRLPAFFRSELLADPRELSRAYRGPIYVTARGLGRYQVHGPEARAYFEELGLSVGFTKVEDLLPGAKDWLRTLESELGMPRGMCTMAAFVNAPGSGLSVHCDRQEQIAIHVRGPKSFRVMPHEARFPKMQHVPGHATPPEWLAQSDDLLAVSRLPDNAERIELHSGSVLYTPRGLYHETLAGDEQAVTVVLAFVNPTPAELLASYLERTLLQSEEWRRPLDFAWSGDRARNEPARERMRKLVEGLGPRLGELSMPRLFASAESSTSEAKDLLPTTRLKRDPSTLVSIRDAGDDKLKLEVAVGLGTGARTALPLPSALRPALTWLAERKTAFIYEEFVSAFPLWNSSALASVVAFLIRAKALVELPFEPWPPSTAAA